MMRSLLAFEWTYHRRQVSSWAFAVGFLLLGFFFGGLGAFGEAELHRDGPWAVAYALGLLSLGSVFVVMVLAAHGILRDVTYGMAPIVHATPISERQFLTARFVGVWTSSILVFSPAVVGYWVGTRMPWIDPEQLGGGDMQAFLWPWLLLAVPNLLLGSSALCAIAAASRSRRLTYVGALLIYAFYMAGSVFVDSPLMAGSSPASADLMTWAALLDPFGMAAFLEQTHLSTLAERNSQQLALAGTFLANRSLWAGVSLLILLVVGRTFRFRGLEGRGARRGKKRSEAIRSQISEPRGETRDAGAACRPVDVATRPRRAWARSLVACSRVEIGLLLRSRPFWLLLLVWVFILAMELVPRAFGGLEYGAGLYPTTALLLSWLETPLLLVASLALIFYAGEVAASERDAGMEGLLDATPVSGRVRIFSKLVALAFLPLLLITVGIVVMLACQLVASYPRHDVPADVLAYGGIYYFVGLRLFLLGALGLAIQTFVGRKYLGMVLTLLAFLSTSGLGVRAGLDHPLLRFAAAPAVPYTDMYGYGPSAGAFPWYMLYWSAWALLALLGADVAGARAARVAGGRLRSLRVRWQGGARTVSAVALLLVLASGAYLYQQSCGDEPCRSPAEELDLRAAYERRYKAFEDLPEPTVVSVEARLDLYPSAGRYRMENRMRLENEEDQALHEVFFTLSEGVRMLDLEVEGATLTRRDDELGVWWFRWREPVAPGETRAMSYVLEGENGTFDLGGSWRDQDVVSNGTYLMEAFFAPRVGYRSSQEIDRNFERRKRGLPEKDETPGDAEHLGLRGDDDSDDDDGYDWVEFEAVVSTEADQIALAPGRLVRQWQDGERSFFHYASDGPMARGIAFASARYEVAAVRHGDVDVEVYHHAGHPENVEHILDVARRSLDYCEASFGPYGRDHLRLVELPASWPFGGFAMPGTITLPSRGTFLVDLRKPDAFDLVAKRVAHEVAHQWWGHRVHPVTGPGSTLVVESLAKYAEWVVLEALHGRRQTRELLEFEHRRYLSGRAADAEPEVPLAQVDGQAYLFYGKGYLAMNALRSELGAEVVHDKLQQFAATWAHPHPAPRAEDLLAVLETDAGPRVRRVVDDWFRRMVHWQVRVVSASTEELSDGSWETSLELETRKFETDADGEVREIPIDDWIQIGLFASDDVLDPGPLMLESRYFDQPTTTLKLRTEARPRVAGIDPLTVLVDQDRLDNLSPL